MSNTFKEIQAQSQKVQGHESARFLQSSSGLMEALGVLNSQSEDKFKGPVVQEVKDLFAKKDLFVSEVKKSIIRETEDTVSDLEDFAKDFNLVAKKIQAAREKDTPFDLEQVVSKFENLREKSVSLRKSQSILSANLVSLLGQFENLMERIKSDEEAEGMNFQEFDDIASVLDNLSSEIMAIEDQSDAVARDLTGPIKQLATLVLEF